MKILSLTITTGLLALGGAAHAQQVFKCTNEDGSVTFQDHVCEDVADTKSAAQSAAIQDSGGGVFSLPGIGEVAIATLDYMETTVLADGDRSTSISIRSKPGASEKMGVVLTFMPNPNGAIPSKAKHQIMARKVVQQFTGVGEFETDFRDFEATSGSGVYSILHDPQFPDRVAPDGEYASIAAGQIVSPVATVIVAIYSDGVDNKAFTDALAVAETFAVTAGGSRE